MVIKFLKYFPFIRSIHAYFFKKSWLNILDKFPSYLPNSSGKYRVRAKLTIHSINRVFPLINSLGKYIKNKEIIIEDIQQLTENSISNSSTRTLKQVLDSYNSDKANHHNYHILYEKILKKPLEVNNIFEIGIGSHNEDISSHMGGIANHSPGASLRAFHDYCPNANIYGADLDKEILIQEDRIKTFYVDQTIPKTFDQIINSIPDNFDLVIDDGLHSPAANIASLEFGLKILKVGGWVVIEDIDEASLNIWKVVYSLLLDDDYEPHIYSACGAFLFAVKRLN
jgi:hypothetical protein